MKNECNVAKDLMPLCIDGVASEESQQYVDEHIAECTECAIAYGSMKVELPLAKVNAEKEHAEMERAAKKLRRKRILRRVITAFLVIAVLVGGVFAWKEIDYQLTEKYSQEMPLDEYRVALVQTKDGAGIIMVNLKDDERRNANTDIEYNYKKSNSSGKNTLEITVRTTVLPQYLDGDRANSAKMLRTLFYGTVINGEWSTRQPWNNPYMEDPRGEQEYTILDEIVVVSGEERKVIYTRGDKIPLCSAEMEAYYEAYHEKQPVGKTYPEWRVDLVKLLDATPELKAESDEEYQRLRYVCENGYLSLDALYYDVSRSAENQEARVQVDMLSFPSGNLPFNAEHKAVAVNNDTGICVQYHIMYAPDDPDAGAGGFYWTGRMQDGVWVQSADDLRDENGVRVTLPIVRIELHAGDGVVVLWEEGDEVLQTPQEAKVKREAEESKYKK